MKKLIFEWDDTKNGTNQTKHDISFEEAQTVFFDESAIQFDDPDHSINEERFLLLGFSQELKVLVVCAIVIAVMNQLFVSFLQGKQLRRSKMYILGDYDEKRI